MNEQGEKINKKNFILIIVFAFFFSLFIHLAFRVTVQDFFQIPEVGMGLAQWGDTFFVRIIASLIPTGLAAFVIGTFLERKAKLAALIYSIPVTLFWIFSLFVGRPMLAEFGFSFKVIKHVILLPLILIISTPLVSYLSAKKGGQYSSRFQGSGKILNIKWYHWVWILPFYLYQIVTVFLFFFFHLMSIDLQHGAMPGILDFIFSWDYYLVRVVILFIFYGIYRSVSHVYELLQRKNDTFKDKVKHGSMIFAHVVLFVIVTSIILS